MPKDEFDFDDPMELSGVGLVTREDTTRDMAECFVEEFMRLGYAPIQILALFRNTHYLGPNMVLQKHGEPFVREIISETFARWGRRATWPTAVAGGSSDAGDPESAEAPSSKLKAQTEEPRLPSSQQIEFDSALVDPTGAPLPKLLH